jgi:purine nucleosidase
MRPILTLTLAVALSLSAQAQQRLILIDQDGSGPGGSNQMAMMTLLQSPKAKVLGITMVTGNAWCAEETAHTLRMLELLHRTDVPVVEGATFPLIRTEEETQLQSALLGGVAWLGAWGGGSTTLYENTGANVSAVSVIYPNHHGPFEIPTLLEGAPKTKSLTATTGEDAAHFLIRQVHAHPHQVTIYAAGPLTNIALALRIDPQFASLTQGIAIMGGSLNPVTNDPEFSESPRHEFNFWFDPEAAHIVLTTPWPDKIATDPTTSQNTGQNIGIVLTTVDISIKAPFTQPMLDEITKAAQQDPATHPAAQYIANYSQERYYLWDELTAAALLDPSIITNQRDILMDVDITHGPEYGNTLTWSEKLRPKTPLQKVHTQLDLNLPKFQKQFVDLMSAQTNSASTSVTK